MVYCCDPKVERLKEQAFLKTLIIIWMLCKSRFESLTILITIFFKCYK